jgi:hypothetical protein
MITRAEAEKLGAVHAVTPAVLSLYVTLPLLPGEVSDLVAHARELIAAAEAVVGGPGNLSEEDRNHALEMLAVRDPSHPMAARLHSSATGKETACR